MALLILGVSVPALAAHARAASGTSHQASADGGRMASPSLGEVPIGAHSMLYLNTPFSAMRAMFEQAAAMGASRIRVDIELSAVFPGPSDTQRSRLAGLMRGRRTSRIGALRERPQHVDPLAHPDWRGVDEYMRLARRYHLRPLAVLTATPPDMAECPRGASSGESYRCPPKDPHQWGRAAGEIAAHTRHVIDDFEILNEPDGHWSFLGGPRQYAAMLAASYEAIHGVDPAGRVALGGLMHIGPAGKKWMNAVFATRGADAMHKFDLANIHLRVAPVAVSGVVCRWRSYFASRGFAGPLWVTETGYPAAARQQTASGYQYGRMAQAQWLTDVIPELLASGVGRIFVTERDLGRGHYATEGVLQTKDPLPPSPQVRRRPGFYAVQRLARDGTWAAAERRDAREQPRTAGSQSGASGSCSVQSPPA
ncbi:MAG: hypothetical protein ACJ764_07345 [Solirubrobacteraceae bacterium]